LIKFKCYVVNCFITYGYILLLILKFYENFEIFVQNFHKISKLSKISSDFKKFKMIIFWKRFKNFKTFKNFIRFQKIQNDNILKKFQKFQSFLRHPWVRFQSFSNSASLVRERLKSYPRVSEISLSCTLPGVRFYMSHTKPPNSFCLHSIERFPAIYFSIAKVYIRFIHMQPYFGSISNVFHHKVQCI
jgi:hypothetical protein